MTAEDIMKLADTQGLVDYFDLDGDSVGQLMLRTFVLDCISNEREAIAQMFDEPMHLVPFVQNHMGGCMICGFTPKQAANSIRARKSPHKTGIR